LNSPSAFLAADSGGQVTIVNPQYPFKISRMDTPSFKFKRPWAFALLVTAAATALCFGMYPYFALTNLVMIYLLGVLLVATRGHYGSAALASTLSVLAFDFYFVPPRFSLSVSDFQYIWTFCVMFGVAMIISHLTLRLRAEAEAARQGLERTQMMHAFSQQLSATSGINNILKAAAAQVAEFFNSAVSVFLPGQDGHLELKARAGASTEQADRELGVAQWVFDRWQSAGLGTQAVPDEKALYVPLQGSEGSAGVLKIEPADPAALLVPEKRLLVDSFAHQIALVLEKDRLEAEAGRAALQAETERMRSSLLSAVSHDLRTPLAAILGSAGALLEKEEFRANLPARELLDNIQTESERLSRLVQNLLEATRLESDQVNIKKELYPLEEVVGSALERLEKILEDRDVRVDLPEDLPLIPMDPVLMEQVFINLFENAVRHTDRSGPIELSAKAEGSQVEVSLADRGPGLNEAELEKVFDKFHRDKSSAGAGLGLAICRAVVHAHGGQIRAGNRPGGGAVFSFNLPLEAVHGR
jgi:two-component system, OmpR family, sensor histidine kinase KdpD